MFEQTQNSLVSDMYNTRYPEARLRIVDPDYGLARPNYNTPLAIGTEVSEPFPRVYVDRAVE